MIVYEVYQWMPMRKCLLILVTLMLILMLLVLNTDFGIADFCVRIMSFTFLHIRLRSCAHIFFSLKTTKWISERAYVIYNNLRSAITIRINNFN